MAVIPMPKDVNLIVLIVWFVALEDDILIWKKVSVLRLVLSKCRWLSFGVAGRGVHASAGGVSGVQT